MHPRVSRASRGSSLRRLLCSCRRSRYWPTGGSTSPRAPRAHSRAPPSRAQRQEYGSRREGLPVPYFASLRPKTAGLYPPGSFLSPWTLLLSFPRSVATEGAESQKARKLDVSLSRLSRSSRLSSNMLDGLKMEENFQSAIETSASFSSLLGRAVSPKSVCEGCQRVISDRFLLRLNDSFWHEQCVQCASCKEPLETTCFYRDKKLYCKYHYENAIMALPSFTTHLLKCGLMVDDITMAEVWPHGGQDHSVRSVASWWTRSQCQKCGLMVDGITVSEV
ncbi:hypothetical protein ACRRTK_004728 [Alexandromys fortis]